MLNGIAPVIIFNFSLVPKSPTFNAISGIPLVGDFVANNLGLPIPIYLDERLTGIYIDSEEKSLDVETNAQNKSTGFKPKIDQRAINSVVRVNMIASRNSVVLTALLALCDIAFTKLASKDYSISYFNGATTIFNGLLQGFSVNADTNDDLYRIRFEISKANAGSTIVEQGASVLTKVTGALPN